MYESKLIPGVILNKYRIALYKGEVCGPEVRGEVIREVMADGWTLAPSENRDEGLVLVAPEAPEHFEKGLE